MFAAVLEDTEETLELNELALEGTLLGTDVSELLDVRLEKTEALLLTREEDANTLLMDEELVVSTGCGVRLALVTLLDVLLLELLVCEGALVELFEITELDELCTDELDVLGLTLAV